MDGKFVFFFQAEDGIRDYKVTGVQTCALPICDNAGGDHLLGTNVPGIFAAGDVRAGSTKRCATAVGEGAMVVQLVHAHLRSEERRVGKECRSRWSPNH